MLQRCTLAAAPAVALSSGRRGGVASAALLSKHRSRAAVCGGERLLLVRFVARSQARSACLSSVPPSSKRRGPHMHMPCSLASLSGAASWLQRIRAAASTDDASSEEDDDDRVLLVAEQEPRVTVAAPRGALASYCRMLRSQTLDWRDTAIVVPRVSGEELLALAAWLNREPLSYKIVAPACAASDALDIPLLLRDVDIWLEAQEAKENTTGGGGVLGEFNEYFHVRSFKPSAGSYDEQEARYIKRGCANYEWAMQLTKNHRLLRFKAALLATLERLSERNARKLLLHVARRELLENAK